MKRSTNRLSIIIANQSNSTNRIKVEIRNIEANIYRYRPDFFVKYIKMIPDMIAANKIIPVSSGNMTSFVEISGW